MNKYRETCMNPIGSTRTYGSLTVVVEFAAMESDSSPTGTDWSPGPSNTVVTDRGSQ